MNRNDDRQGHIVRKILIPSDLSDFDIPWGDNGEWKKRANAAPPLAKDALASLALYWKYAWNTARSPHLTIRLAETFSEREGDDLAERLWDALLEADEYRLSVVGSQVLAYSAFYFAYESFLTECCAVRLGENASEMMGYAKIKDAVIRAFDSKTEAAIWSDTSIEIARRARNSLVHNAGVPDESLKSLSPDLLIDGYISIHPVDVASLFKTLKQKVDTILSGW